jgi:hypothetical protein
MDWMERLKFAWTYLWTGELPVQHPKFTLLIASPLSDAVKKAVEKISADRYFSVKMSEAKRKEALQWTGVYLNDKAVPPVELWETGFLIEYWVGILSGRL